MQGAHTMTDKKKAVIWTEWENGSPMSRIAKAIDKPPATVFSYLQYHGELLSNLVYANQAAFLTD